MLEHPIRAWVQTISHRASENSSLSIKKPLGESFMRTLKATSQKKKNGVLFSIALAGAILASPLSARADIVYWTSQPNGTQTNGEIEAYNTATGTNKVIDANAGNPDSLLFANTNTIVYDSNPSSGSNLYEYNTSLKTNTILATGAELGLSGTSGTSGTSGAIRDLTLTPSGNSVLVSSYATGNVYKVNLSTKAVSLFTTGSSPQGIVYTGGNLFLNLGSGIEELNPTTGAVILSNITYKNLDGLTYDKTTGLLYATSGTYAADGGASILQINPATLAEKVLPISGAGISSSLNLDGIEASSNGNLYIANYMHNMLEYYTGTNSTTLLTTALGIDDVSPVTGLGGSNIAGTPEPGTFALFGTGILLMSLLMFRSRKNTESC